jgi:hypothetical protein
MESQGCFDLHFLETKDVERFFLFFFVFLLDIFFISISNDIMKVLYNLPLPYSSTHTLSLFGPGVPLYWDI